MLTAKHPMFSYYYYYYYYKRQIYPAVSKASRTGYKIQCHCWKHFQYKTRIQPDPAGSGSQPDPVTLDPAGSRSKLDPQNLPDIRPDPDPDLDPVHPYLCSILCSLEAGVY